MTRRLSVDCDSWELAERLGSAVSLIAIMMAALGRTFACSWLGSSSYHRHRLTSGVTNNVMMRACRRSLDATTEA